MLNRILFSSILTITMVLSASSFVFADPNEHPTLEERCLEYAKEDGVEESQLQDYMEQCINELKETETQENEETIEPSDPQESKERTTN